MSGISKFQANKLADAWEARTGAESDPKVRETLRECADTIRMFANVEPVERPRAPSPLRYCPDCDGSFPCQLPGRHPLMNNLNSLVEVTQADRDAAADWLALVRLSGTLGLIEDIRDGKADHNPLVQAFARHRIQALEKAEAEIERLTWAKMAADGFQMSLFPERRHWSGKKQNRRAAKSKM